MIDAEITNDDSSELKKQSEGYRYVWNDEANDRTIIYKTIMSVFRNLISTTFMLSKDKKECVVVQDVDQDIKLSVKFNKRDIEQLIDELIAVHDRME